MKDMEKYKGKADGDESEDNGGNEHSDLCGHPSVKEQ